MKKILVPTDFSKNSKTAVRFAIQLAQQQKFELTFFHSYTFIKPFSWSETTFKSQKRIEKEKTQKKLIQYVKSIYKSKGIVTENVKYVIKESIFTDSNIREYALKNNYNFICISTRGAGTINKIFGTTTSNLINFSSVPIIVVPNNYRSKKIKKILYTSDFVNIDSELKKVMTFSKPLEAKVKLLHFNFPFNKANKKSNIATFINKYPKGAIDLHLIDCDHSDNLISKINESVLLFKPSILVMFTRQNRSFFEKLFYSSKSENYSFYTNVPLLIFNKMN